MYIIYFCNLHRIKCNVNIFLQIYINFTKKERKLKVYTMKELQEILKMSEPTVRKLIQDKKLIKLEADKAVRVSEKALSNYLEGK